MPIQFNIVQDLIDHLVRLGPDRTLILDYDGNTRHVTSDDVALWDKNDDTPVAIYNNIE